MFRHVYIHVPYCVSKCPYCDFFSVDDNRGIESFVDALGVELAISAKVHGPLRDVETVYIGGGTPSHLGVEEIEHLGQILQDHVQRSPDCEWTVEVNPESATREKLDLFLGMGVNRFSVGVQSLRKRELGFLGRAHDPGMAIRAVGLVADSSARSWSLDIMFGFAGQTLDSLRTTFRETLAFDPPHVSAYALMIEPGSRFAEKPDREWSAPPDEVADQYRFLREALRAAGIEQYEVSNYAHPGHRSRHNLAYWGRVPYAGFGPSAHSFDGQARWWNVRSIDRYLEATSEGRAPIDDREVLTAHEELEERIMLGLRLSDGIGPDIVRGDGWARMTKIADLLAEEGLVRMDDDRICLVNDGWAVADAVIERLVSAAVTSP
jgi:putative oxygen-independent coproporphyrinogen III oxidase